MIDKEKLAKVLGLLGSDYDGEVVSAARRAQSLLADEGLTWFDVIVAPDNDTSVEACRQLIHENYLLRKEIDRLSTKSSSAQPTYEKPETAREAINLCIAWTADLTDWEREFISSVAGWRGNLTEKKKQRLIRIVGKIERIAK